MISRWINKTKAYKMSPIRTDFNKSWSFIITLKLQQVSLEKTKKWLIDYKQAVTHRVLAHSVETHTAVVYTSASAFFDIFTSHQHTVDVVINGWLFQQSVMDKILDFVSNFNKNSCPIHAMWAIRGRRDSFTSAVDGGEWSTSCLGRTLPRRKVHRYPLVRGWVDIRGHLATEARGKILCLSRGSNPGHLVCSQTL
jgi:hypothetical protein